MNELTCIVCPIGCSLTVSQEGGKLTVSGNKCNRGQDYAIEELTAPKRVVTATAATTIAATNRVPVKTTLPCPKEKINELLTDIYKQKVSLPVKVGDVVISNWQGMGFDVVVTRSME